MNGRTFLLEEHLDMPATLLTGSDRIRKEVSKERDNFLKGVNKKFLLMKSDVMNSQKQPHNG